MSWSSSTGISTPINGLLPGYSSSILQPAYVKAKLDLEKLQQEADKKLTEKRELNGIAYNSTTGNIMITGKKWPMMYEISVSGLPAEQ